MIRRSHTLSSLLRRRLNAFAGNERGVTAVEFALLALPFFTIVAGILQTAVVFLTGQVLESAVNDASRSIRTGQAEIRGSTLDTFRAEVCDRLFGLINDCDGLHIRVSEVVNFASAEASVPVDLTCTEECGWSRTERWQSGTGKSVMMVQVYYKYPVYIQLGPFSLANLPGGKRLMGAATVFKNEPYS